MLHQFKSWVEGFAERPSASRLLFVLAFCEASIFPLPPDYLMIPLSLARPKRSFWYATVCITGSILGASLGYVVGHFFFDAVGSRLVVMFGWTELLHSVLLRYSQNAWWTLLLAGFTPIPFQLFSLVAGINNTVPFPVFLPAALCGRMLRFYLVATLLFFFGPKVREWSEKYTGWVTLAVLVALVAWIVLTALYT